MITKRLASEVLGCAIIMILSVIIGVVLGFGVALIALAFAEGTARGGEMLFIGFAILAGAGIGLTGGAICSIRWMRRRRAGATTHGTN